MLKQLDICSQKQTNKTTHIIKKNPQSIFTSRNKQYKIGLNIKLKIKLLKDDEDKFTLKIY